MVIAKSKTPRNFVFMKDCTVWLVFFGASFPSELLFHLYSPTGLPSKPVLLWQRKRSRAEPCPRSNPRSKAEHVGLAFLLSYCMQPLQPRLSEGVSLFLSCAPRHAEAKRCRPDGNVSCETHCWWARMGRITRTFGSGLVCFLLCKQIITRHILQVLLGLPPSKWQLRQGWDGSVGTFLLFSIPSSCPSVSPLPQSDGAVWTKGISSVL